MVACDDRYIGAPRGSANPFPEVFLRFGDRERLHKAFLAPL